MWFIVFEVSDEMSECVLSILISTYRRKELLQRNLEEMLACEDDRVEFILCDNASEDGTWEYLRSIQDPRVHVYRNKRNYGFENFWLISEYANGRFFMFVNDRDYIDPIDIRGLLKQLNSLGDFDFITHVEGEKYPSGVYLWKDAVNLYFQARHPGYLIYRCGFVKKVLSLERIRRYIENGRPQDANIYLVFSLLLNVEKVHHFPWHIIEQPPNRERIHQVRGEYYEYPYVSPEYRIEEYKDWMKGAESYRGNERTGYILETVYRDALRTVAWEYYFSMKIPGFAERNRYKGHTSGEWFLNLIKFTQGTIALNYVYFSKKRTMLMYAFECLIETLKNIWF